MFGKKQQADLATKAQETRANAAIANQEAAMDQQRKGVNVQAALGASQFNATAIMNADRINAANKMTVDEFNSAADAATKDRRLMALDTGVKSATGLYSDLLQYKAQDRLASAISGETGVKQREQMRTLLRSTGNYTEAQINELINKSFSNESDNDDSTETEARKGGFSSYEKEQVLMGGGFYNRMLKYGK